MGRSCFLGLLALAVFACGIGLSIWWLMNRMTEMDDGMTRVPAPGDAAFTLDKPGVYTIFFEYKGVLDGRVFTSSANLADMSVGVSSPSGEPLPLEPVNMSASYDLGSRSGIGVYTFKAEVPGEYTISSAYDEGIDYGSFIFAIGTDFTGSIIGSVFGMMGLIFGTFILAAALLVLAILVHPKVKAAFRRPSPMI